MTNPIKAIRKKLELSRSELGEATNTDYHTIYVVENGRVSTIPKRLISGFKELGLNPERIQVNYNQWRKERAEKKRDQVRRKLEEETDDLDNFLAKAFEDKKSRSKSG